jgi:hypothetical protein
MNHKLLDCIDDKDMEFIDKHMNEYRIRDGQGLKIVLTYFLAEYKNKLKRQRK